MSTLRRTQHAVYDLKYHLVWATKYRHDVIRPSMQVRLQEIFQEIGQEYEIEIDTLEIQEDHVHLFVLAPPRYAPADLVRIFKSRSAKQMFAEFPALRQRLWGGQLWSDGYFVRSVGDQVTAEVVRRYIRYQKQTQAELDLGWDSAE